MNKYCYALLFPLTFWGCKDKEMMCSVRRTKIQGTFVFAGYTAAELDTIVVRRYPDKTFTTPLSIDSLISPAVEFEGPTAFTTGRTGFGSLFGGSAYEVLLPVAQRSYLITDILYSNDTMIYWTDPEKCNTKVYFLHPPDSFIVNGSLADIVRTGSTTATVLRK